MKVIHSALVRFMRGRLSGAVLYEAPSQEFSIQRNYVYPTLTPHNHSMGAIMKNLRTAFWTVASNEYKADFKTYAARYYSENLDLPNYEIPVNNSFGCFIRGMFAIYNADPTHVDLELGTPADFIILGCPFESVADMITAGMLPTISLWSDLTANFS